VVYSTLFAALLLLISSACSTSNPQSAGSVPAAPAREARTELIDHLEPARDSTGRMPPRFRWTPVPGDARYEITVWNEIDVLVWRAGDLREPTVERPADIVLEPGTYFWTVIATRGDRLVAGSGRSAFVVMEWKLRN
jgi:hypothetical protein